VQADSKQTEPEKEYTMRKGYKHKGKRRKGGRKSKRG
jgi:hypothetical protein